MNYYAFMSVKNLSMGVAIFVGGLLVVGAQATETDSRKLMAVVEQWVELQNTIHQEQTEWKQQRESLQHSLSLLKREQEQLTARIDAAAADMDEYAEAKWEEEQLRTSLQRVLAEAAEQIPEDTRDPASERLRTLLDDTVRAHRENRTLHIDRARMTSPEGHDIQMQQLRLGTTQAYAVSPDDQFAAHGVWDGEEWHWRWNSDWATPIRTALRIAEGEIAPRWIALPVTLMEAEPPE